ncbi:Eco57I restriction-modification methylase domain-containing protein [Dictyobacter arantiisoli]|uniref:site-specific DNA-methyltransferase (adenine-specific) n=1 Tax=Dictyobacter arantiisoli TaxID=2014874 RepID=A0A5A5T8Q3_9CHLR|nr:TaqI-like C-terminal specificity domain-containing protein [Dictyobacter arantiisoli]GCF07792.1 hypothetical protein KDI_13560 [Dictyobacter arantiisoli]
MPQNATFVVTKANVRQISSDKLCADFFSSLGFDKHSANVLSEIELKSLLQELHPRHAFSQQGIKLFRVAQRKDMMGEFTVYLYLLPTVTQTLAKQIFKDLVKLNGEFLVILADPIFNEIEIVYVDRHASAAAALQQPLPGLATSSAPAQFRSLSFSRTDISDKVVRVLNRFFWPAERPVITQRAVLSSAFDVAEWSEDYFTNRALFSDYYLNSTLREKQPWKDVEHDANFTRAWNKLKQAYEEAGDALAGQPASVLRERLLDETLRTLGFDYTIERSPRTTTGQRLPDYVLFSSRLPRRAEGQPIDKEQNKMSVCLAYEWNRNLDGYSDKADVFNGDNEDALDLNSTDFENPGAAIVSLFDQQPEQQVNWAILTNGKIWRLYSAKAHNRATNYYEIDLEDTLAISRDNPQEAKDAFRYFWLFFRAQAFVLRNYDDYKEEQTFLDYVLHESTEYAIKLGDSLKKMIFDEVFAHFAGGLVASARAKGTLPLDLSIYDEQQQQRLLKPFFDATLTFLYRLLFLLYAESRSLLPIYEQHGYRTHSLSQMKRKIADELKNNRAQAYDKLDKYKTDRYDYYEQLQALFKAIDKGNEEWNIPVYNGGLFQTEVAERNFRGMDTEGFPLIAQATPEEILKQHQINDQALVTGLDLLTRDKDSNRSDALVMIDYKSLGVRQLGSIYEGLLEFKLRLALEEMVEVKGNKIITFTEAIKSGLYKSGKTPLIPRNTVYIENDHHERKTSGSYYTPDYIVEYIVAQTVGPIMDEKEIQILPRFRDQENKLRNSIKRNKALGDPNHKRNTLDKSLVNQALVDEFFDIKVLDPAMGSGHFLVETVDFITRRMLAFLNRIPLNPVTEALKAIRTSILEEMEIQNVFIDRNKLTDINLLKRQILKRCVYGVDLNPMAVELAKVSVWLDSFTVGAPLSFLDHHLKCGNSLIGTDSLTIEGVLKDSLWGNQYSDIANGANAIINLSKKFDISIEDIKASKLFYAEYAKKIDPYKNIMNVWTSEHFGNKGAQLTVKIYLKDMIQQIYNNMNQIDIEAMESAQVIAQLEKNKFFHWELEFPDVFFDEKGRKPEESGGFDSVISNPPYRVLIKSQVGQDLIKHFNANYNSSQYNPNLFALMIEKGFSVCKSSGFVSYIIPSLWLTNTYLSNLRKLMMHQGKILQIANLGFGVFKEVVETSIFISKKETRFMNYQIKLANRSESDKIQLLPNNLFYQDIINNIESGFYLFRRKSDVDSLKKFSEPLSSSFTVYRGIETRDNQKYISDEKLTDSYQEILMGTDVGRYYSEWSGNYVKFVPKELKSNADIKMYKVDEKILLRRTGSKILAGLDNRQLFAIKNLYVILPKRDLTTKYLLALINSRLIDYYNQSMLDNIGDAFAQLKITDIEAFPIRRINFAKSEHLREFHRRQAQKLYESYVSNLSGQQSILSSVDQHLAKEPEESDVIHDLLVLLTDDMLRLNKEKRALQREFLDWLAEYLRIQPQPDPKSGKVGIDALTHKSDLLNYPGDYQKGEDALSVEALERILQENKKRYLLPFTSSKWLEIQDRYRANLTQVLPMKKQLKQTDTLIDQIVYKLYGLTEDEIRVVEGSVQ